MCVIGAAAKGTACLFMSLFLIIKSWTRVAFGNSGYDFDTFGQLHAVRLIWDNVYGTLVEFWVKIWDRD